MSDLRFMETDAGKILDEILIELENSINEPLYPGDERRIYAEGLAMFLAAFAVKVNDACRQKMLRYARGPVLDALGENRSIYRIDPTPATCTIKFMVSEPLSQNVVIPQGVQVTSDFDRFFETDRTVVLYAGNTDVTVSATSIGGGSRFNDIAKGKIVAIATPQDIPLIDGCTNIDTTHSGGDAEEDDALRLRIRNGMNRHSTAGSESSYKFWAMSANSTISDVAVVSDKTTIEGDFTPIAGHIFFGGGDLDPTTLIVNGESWTDYTFNDCLLDIKLSSDSTDPVHVSIQRSMAGFVKIVPICYGGELPNRDVLDDVLASCNAENVRPLTDHVEVAVPDVESYDIELTYYCKKGTETGVIEAVEGAGGSIVQYNSWQQSTFMPSINPDKLKQLILCPHDKEGNQIQGAYRVDITKPEFKELNGTTIAKWSGKSTIHHVIGKG